YRWRREIRVGNGFAQVLKRLTQLEEENRMRCDDLMTARFEGRIADPDLAAHLRDRRSSSPCATKRDLLPAAPRLLHPPISPRPGRLNQNFSARRGCRFTGARQRSK